MVNVRNKKYKTKLLQHSCNMNATKKLFLISRKLLCVLGGGGGGGGALRGGTRGGSLIVFY